MASSDVVIRGFYTTKTRTGGTRGASPGAHVDGYENRDEACEPLFPEPDQPRTVPGSTSGTRPGTSAGIHPEDAPADSLDGRLFGMHPEMGRRMSATHRWTRAAARLIQKLFEAGRAIRIMVVSFATSFLERVGALAPERSRDTPRDTPGNDRGKTPGKSPGRSDDGKGRDPGDDVPGPSPDVSREEPQDGSSEGPEDGSGDGPKVSPVGSRVDIPRIRRAVTRAIDKLCRHHVAPVAAAAVHTNTDHIHAHVVIAEAGPATSPCATKGKTPVKLLRAAKAAAKASLENDLKVLGPYRGRGVEPVRGPSVEEARETGRDVQAAIGCHVASKGCPSEALGNTIRDRAEEVVERGGAPETPGIFTRAVARVAGIIREKVDAVRFPSLEDLPRPGAAWGAFRERQGKVRTVGCSAARCALTMTRAMEGVAAMDRSTVEALEQTRDDARTLARWARKRGWRGRPQAPGSDIESVLDTGGTPKGSPPPLPEMPQDLLMSTSYERLEDVLETLREVLPDTPQVKSVENLLEAISGMAPEDVSEDLREVISEDHTKEVLRDVHGKSQERSQDVSQEKGPGDVRRNIRRQGRAADSQDDLAEAARKAGEDTAIRMSQETSREVSEDLSQDGIEH